jgi:hypothetical protein
MTRPLHPFLNPADAMHSVRTTIVTKLPVPYPALDPADAMHCSLPCGLAMQTIALQLRRRQPTGLRKPQPSGVVDGWPARPAK